MFIISLFVGGRTEAHWYFDNGFIYITIALVMLEALKYENMKNSFATLEE